MTNDMEYATGRHDALQGRPMVARHGADYARGYRAGLRAIAKEQMHLSDKAESLITYAQQICDDEIQAVAALALAIACLCPDRETAIEALDAAYHDSAQAAREHSGRS